jgi:hypothetical protein
MTNLMSEAEKKTFNLRKELAKHIWNARRGQINIAETLENTRDLVSLCPNDIIEIADRLQHKIMAQITKIYGKICLQRKGFKVDDLKSPSVKTRFYLNAVRLPQNMIG